MKNWFMLTVVGIDAPGIVANLTDSLYHANCNLGEASMMRLGGNFTVMMMVNCNQSSEEINQLLQPVCEKFNLRTHLEMIQSHLHDHPIPDIQIRVSGADRAGIVSKVTQTLFDAGLDILDLDSAIAGTVEKPIYIMQIEGVAKNGFDMINNAIQTLSNEGIDVHADPIETMIV